MAIQIPVLIFSDFTKNFGGKTKRCNVFGGKNDFKISNVCEEIALLFR